MCCDANRNRQKDAHGNAALDVVLFLPLALFFLFVVTDGGLTLVQQAELRDSVRAGLHAEYASASPFLLTRDGSDLLSEVDTTAARNLAEHLADELYSRIAPSSETSPRRGVEVSIFLLEIDPKTGALLQASPKRVATSYQPGNSFPQSAIVSSYPYKSREDYLKEELIDPDKEASIYAQNLGPVYQLNGEVNSDLRYASKAAVVYVEVRAVVQGINAEFSKSALGRFYGFQLQHLQPLRSSVN